MATARLQDLTAGYDRYLTPDPEAEKGYFYRSDHISLAKKGVPMLYADDGADLVDGGTDAGEAYGAEYDPDRPDWYEENEFRTLRDAQRAGE